jgi:hypothetical protein
MGRTDLFLQNAEKLGVKIDQVDLAVVSHGHHDHGGGLGAFLAENKKANVYVHTRAFERHLSLKQGGVLGEIGLNPLLRSSDRIIFVGERAEIAPGMTLFSGVNERTLFSRCNDTLYMVKDDATVADDFQHEQNLILAENGKLVLFAGCAHCGIVNILRRAEENRGQAHGRGFRRISPAKPQPEEKRTAGAYPCRRRSACFVRIGFLYGALHRRGSVWSAQSDSGRSAGGNLDRRWIRKYSPSGFFPQFCSIRFTYLSELCKQTKKDAHFCSILCKNERKHG